MTELYGFNFICSRCKKIFDGHSTVKPTKDWISGFQCYDCSQQVDLTEYIGGDSIDE